MKRFRTAFVVALFMALVHHLFFVSRWGEAVELRFLDLWFNLHGPVAPPEEIVVVAMDEDSYATLGFSPNQAWPRQAHAQLLQRLAAAGARRVVLDILFFGEGPDPAVDDQLANAMRQVPTIIGAELASIEKEENFIAGSSRWFLPLEKFREAATVALVGVPEYAGQVRSFLLPTNELSTLAVAASGASRLPGPRDMIRYYGPRRTITTYSYDQVLETDPPLPASTFRDKIVFVGLSMRTGLGPDQKDSYLTSFPKRGRVFGVEIHATATANLLRQDFIRRASTEREAWVLDLIAACATFGLLYIRPIGGALTWVVCSVSWATLAYSFFLRGVFIPGAVLTFITLPATYLGATLTNYLITRLRQLRLQRAFQLYLSPEMARQVAQNPEALKLGGEVIEGTAMFTDIAGFTNIAEQMKPADVGRMLNAYFTEVMDAVFDKRGTLVQFIGDGVYALWGAPLRTAEHARFCCEAALAIQQEIERFNQSGRFPVLPTRFGINTGPILVGNLGTSRRFDFTGIGDTVNLASRVEGLNKRFGTTILITDSTRAQAAADLAAFKLGLIKAVGKTQPVGLHAIFAQPIAGSVAQQWEEACRQFVAREWHAADELFAAAAQAEARLTKAALLYHQEIERHIANPPAGTWQGEITFASK